MLPTKFISVELLLMSDGEVITSLYRPLPYKASCNLLRRYVALKMIEIVIRIHRQDSIIYITQRPTY